MAALVDPFDSAAPVAQPQPSPAVASGEGLVDPFDSAPAAAPMPATMPPAPPSGRTTPFLVENVRERAYEAADMLARMGRGARDMVTGESRREFDLPEIRGAFGMENPPRDAANYARYPQGLGMLSLGRDDQQKAGIFQEQNPGSQVRTDKFGNAIVSWGGQDFFLNRPGVSGQDFRDLATQGLAIPLAARGAQLGGQALGFLGRTVGAGLGFGAGGAAVDEAALAAGAPQGATLAKGVVDTGVGVMGEAVAPLIGRLVAPAMQRGEGAFRNAAGDPTEFTMRAFAEAGIDVGRVTPRMVEAFAREARRAANPAEAARLAAAETLPVRVSQTRGQVSGLASDQMFEDLARKGAYGRSAETTMAGQAAQQQEQLRANVPAIQQMLGGGQVAERGQGGQAAQAALVAGRDAAKATAEAAYRQAREAGHAGLPAPVTERMAFNLKQAAADHDVGGLPRTQRLLDDFADMTNKQDSVTLVRSLFDWRKKANNALAAGGEEAVAVKKLIKQLDGDINDAIEGALLSGNKQAVAQWRDAIGKYRDFKQTWESPDLIGRLVQREQIAGQSRLTVAPDAAANYIFGKSDLAFASKPELARDLLRMRDLLGPNSPEWRALKEEAWLRLARAGEGAMEGGTAQFSGAKFKTAWHNANFQNAPLMRVLFNESEQRLISQFADVAARTTNPVRGGQNFSNTTPAMANIAQRVWDTLALGPSGKAWLSVTMPGVFNRVQGIRATGRTNVNAAPLLPAPGTVGPATGLVLKNSNQ